MVRSAVPSLVGWIEALGSIPGVRLLVVALSIVVGAALSRVVVRLIGRPVARQFSRQSVAQTIVRGVRLGTVTAAFLTGLWLVGFRFTDLLIGTAVLSAIIGIILAPLVGNFINGLFILADQPFEIGDMVALDDGTKGFVDDITIRYTKIFTLDNTFLVVPNGNIRERDVINYSAEDERTRRRTDVLVTYESDVTAARRLIERAARDCEAVIDGGPDIRIGVARYVAGPDCRLHEFGDDGILLRLRYWVKKPYKLAKVQSEVNTNIRDRLANADVEMAYPHRHLVFDETSGIARVDASGSGAGVSDTRATDDGADTEATTLATTDSGTSETSGGDLGALDPDVDTEE
jgi:small-conductance mechanosensitive channel